MINATLVEQFAGILRQRQSGVLTAIGPQYRLRFCFQDGDPVALDFGTDKQLIFANTLLEFHKLGSELHQDLVEARNAGQGTVTEMVRRRQVVNDDEIGQVTRAMVEDALVRCFGTMHYEAGFDTNDGIESFDFEKSAVRLRIGTQILLGTVQTRVAEIERVMAAAGGGQAVFALSEGDSGSDKLSEYEKNVLNFVDGRKTVEEIAIAFRESTLNMARLLTGMVGRGVLHRQTQLTTVESGPGANSGGSRRLAPVAGAGSSATRAALPPPPAPPRRTNLIVLSLALVATTGLGALVVQWQARQRAIEATATAFHDNLEQRRWADARKQIEAGRTQAGNDLEALDRVSAMDDGLSRALASEREAIGQLIESGEFAGLAQRVAALPADAGLSALSISLQQAQAAFTQRSAALKDRVARLLDAGDPAAALALLAGAPHHEGDQAGEYLSHWRVTALEKASSAANPLSQRLALIAQLRDAAPTAAQGARIASIQAGIAEVEKRVVGQLHDLGTLLDQGAYVEAQAEWDRQRLDEQVRDTPMAPAAAAVVKRIAAVRDELAAAADTALAQARERDDRTALAAAAAAVDAVLAVRTRASNAADLRAAAGLAMELGELLAPRPEEKNAERGDARQAELIDAWLAEHPQPAPLAKVAKARAARYRQHESESQEMYGNGHTLRTQGDFAGARARLEEVVARPEWKRTAAHDLAVRDLDELSVAVSRQEALGAELDQAMDKGDIPRCYALIRELGIKYPPLLVQSEPPGAEVWQDGKRLGQAPLKLAIPGGERASATFELRRDGYVTRTISGAAAENGWRLVAHLERSAAQRFELALTVTSRPTVLDGRVWVANRQQAVAVAPAGKPERVLFESAAASAGTLAQPLYTAPVLADDGVLFATRDGLALRIAGSGGALSVERLPLGGRSDLPLVSYRSQNIVGRRFLAVAGQDGALHAVDEHHPELAWNGPAGAPFAAAPTLVGERILVVRQDGRLESVQADDGQPARGAALDAAVVAAWATPTGLAGFTTGRSWAWDGTTLSGGDLPQPAVAGGAGVFITADNHAWVQGGDAQHPWRDLGRFDGKLGAEPLAWQGHAVLPLGHSLAVLGAKPFTVASTVDILPPALIGDQLVVTTMDGVVSIYAP